MYKTDLEVIEYDKWNRKLLNIYWYSAAIAVFTELLIFFIAKRRSSLSNFEYLAFYVVRPAILDAALLALTEWLHTLLTRRNKEMVKYLITFSGTLLACNMVYVHYSVSVIYVLFIFPIILSGFYASKRLTFMAAGINLAAYLIMVFIYLPTRPGKTFQLDFTNFATTLAFIVCTLLLVLSSLNRVKEIIQSLIKIHESQQDLAVQNFVMEFNSKMEPATGLYNHKTFYEYLGDLIGQSESYGFPLSLAVFDIDNFKRINDTYGHSHGDEVIKALSEIIKGSIGTDDYAARYGGEEFAIIFTDKDRKKAYEIVEGIRKRFNAVSIDSMKNERFSVSIGVSEHVRGMSMQQFFGNTDNAVYRAKGSGKNRVAVFEEEDVKINAT
ncbi:MAG: GGDEF domain-containing protein [Bacillota bacterium]|nr:GGDEF domain-containing protein [Bacillota bacterium]